MTIPPCRFLSDEKGKVVSAADAVKLIRDGGKDSGLCRIRHIKPDHVGLWIMSDSCALSLSGLEWAGVWTFEQSDIILRLLPAGP